MATLRVKNQSELLSALKTATGGDTILLADGDYGEVTLKNTYKSAVTIKAEHEGKASFDKISLTGASNLTFDGLHLDEGFSARNTSSHITLENITSDNLLYFRNVSDLTVDHVTATGGQYSILLNSVQGFSVTNSTFGGVTEDVMRITGNSYDGLIENNTLADTIASKPTHPDLIQMFAAEGVTPHDITIRGNLIYDDPATGDSDTAAQGIFMAGATSSGYSNILIEENLIYTRSTNSIFVGGGQENVVIQNNTLLSSSGDGGAIIRLSSFKGFDNSGTTVTGNIAKMILDETHSSDIGDNYLYGRGANLSALFHGTDGTSWESFLTVSGSAADGYGATARLAELLKLHGLSSGTEETAAIPNVGAEAPVASDPVSAVYSSDISHELTGSKKTVVTVANDSKMSLDEGTIALTFNADTVSGNRGLISKGAAGYDDDISAWIQNGNLVVCLENETGAQTRITYKGVTANTDHDLLISFDDGKIQVWLDDKMVGSASFDFDLASNTESLVIGGVNGSSTRGTTDKMNSYFDGTISHVGIYDHALTPAELDTYLKLAHDSDTVLMSQLA